MTLIQRIIFIVLFIASVSQAMASAMMPDMSMMNAPASSVSMQSMTSDQDMIDCQSMNECMEQCDCCPGACSSGSLILMTQFKPLNRGHFISHPILHFNIASPQNSLYRPPISA